MAPRRPSRRGSGSSAGHDRERQLRRVLEHDVPWPRKNDAPEFVRMTSWVVVRAAGSLGPIDLVAMNRGFFNDLAIEVKSTIGGPYHSFGPEDRREMLEICERAGASAWLAWWPGDGSGLRWIHSSAWPETRGTIDG